MREGSGGEKAVGHAWEMPAGVEAGLASILKEEAAKNDKEGAAEGVETLGPFISKRLGISNRTSPSTLP